MSDETITMTEAEMERLVEAASEKGAKKALSEFLDHVDINWDDREQRVELREDLRWVRRARRLLEVVGGRILLVLISIVTGAVFIFMFRSVWQAIKHAAKAI